METVESGLPLHRYSDSSAAGNAQTRKIEDYRPGYPRYTTLLAAYDPYMICRRFSKIRARLLLLKQDRLSVLEERLEQVDKEERSPLFLGKARCDKNLERISLLSEIESKLAEYGKYRYKALGSLLKPEIYKFASQTRRMLSFSSAQQRDVESLQNWLDGNGCLAREESAYLAHHEELVSLAPASDSAILTLEAWVENRLIRSWQSFWKRHLHNMSNDPNVYIYPGRLIQRIAKAILLFFITLLLLAPVVICNIIKTPLVRILVVMVSTITYLIVISAFTKSRTIELVLAGATYATVLTVFVSGTGFTKS